MFKRTYQESIWLWKEGEKSVASQEPLEWGWKMKNGRFVPKWEPDKNTTTVEMISKICCCSTRCKNCRCAKNNVKCLIFCKCQGRCQNNDSLMKMKKNVGSLLCFKIC